MIDDIRQWTFSHQADTLLLQGELSDTGLRQINSIVAQPVQALFRGIGATSDGSGKGLDMSPAASTKRYLDKIDICFMKPPLKVRRQSPRGMRISTMPMGTAMAMVTATVTIHHPRPAFAARLELRTTDRHVFSSIRSHRS